MKLCYHCAFPKNDEMFHVYVLEQDTAFEMHLSKEIFGNSVVFPRETSTLYDAVEKANKLVRDTAWMDEKSINKLIKTAEEIWSVNQCIK